MLSFIAISLPFYDGGTYSTFQICVYALRWKWVWEHGGENKQAQPQLIMQIDADVIDVKESMYFERCKDISLFKSFRHLCFLLLVCFLILIVGIFSSILFILMDVRDL